MSSLVENLEKAAEVNEQLEALIREAHSAIKTMRRTERDAKASIEDLVDKAGIAQLTPLLDEYLIKVRELLDESVQTVMRNFKRVSEPIMKSLDLIEEADQRGAFFNRDG